MNNNLLKCISICFLAIASVANNANAEEETNKFDLPGEFSANVTLASDYIFRGITQSDENPAIQGGIDWNYDIDDSWAFNIGTWASNVDFNDGSEATSEFDVYSGISYSYENWSFNVYGTYYFYPGASDNLNYDYFEVSGQIGYDFELLNITATAVYSPENFGETGDASYYEVATEVPLPYNFTFNAHYGHQEINDEVGFGVPDYNTWGAGITYSVEGVDIGVNYIDTDINKSDCADGCDARVLFSVSKSF